MYGIMLIVVLVLTGGVIAFIGDRLGSKVGKKKLSLFGMRPKHTSILVTIVTGILITTVTFGVLAVASENVRTALFGMEKLREEMKSTQDNLMDATISLETMKKDLTCVCAVSNKITAAIEVQKLFSNNYFRVYTSDDIIGSQIASSYKNAIAIGSGIIQGLNYGKNAEAAIVTRGLNEIIKFGSFNGGKINTFLGLTGIGDLLLTCSSKLSRNYCFGIEVAKSNDINALIKNNKKTIEGLRTIKVIHDFSKINNLDTPIIDALYNVLYLNKNINDEINSLMLRPLKSE